MLSQIITEAREQEWLIANHHFKDQVIDGLDGRHQEFDAVIFENCRLVNCSFAGSSFPMYVWSAAIFPTAILRGATGKCFIS